MKRLGNERALKSLPSMKASAWKPAPISFSSAQSSYYCSKMPTAASKCWALCLPCQAWAHQCRYPHHLVSQQSPPVAKMPRLTKTSWRRTECGCPWVTSPGLLLGLIRYPKSCVALGDVASRQQQPWITFFPFN